MTPLKNISEIKKYCRANWEYIEGPIRSVVVEFQGLNRLEYLVQPSCQLELELASENILYVIPYTDPWGWMNETQAQYTDWLLERLFELLSIDRNVPVISTGYSMGGLGALMYPVFSRHNVSACMANSPVCDLVSHFTERDDLPRTLMSAFMSYPGGLEAGLESRSPIHQIDRLKQIPYFIVAGWKDTDVSIKNHSQRLTALMQERGMTLTYYALPTMIHWKINDYRVLRASIDFIKGGYQKTKG